MNETSIHGMKRTHMCGNLRLSDAGQEVTVNGWVDRVRDNGGVLFLLVRDRAGIVQIVPQTTSVQPQIRSFICLDHPEIGSICSGGRYDNLAEYYTDKQLPGVGISIGLTRLFYVLGEQGYLNDKQNCAPADVLILPMTDDTGAGIATATALRGAGIRTQLYSEQKKFKHKIGYADKLGIPYVVFLGEDEIREGVLAVKDMETGEQVKVSLEEAVSRIRDGLATKNQGKVIMDKAQA